MCLWHSVHQQQAVREDATIYPVSCKLTFDLLTLKVVHESGVTWATSVPILVFIGPSVLDLGPMYATTDRRQTSDIRRVSSLNARYPRGGVIVMRECSRCHRIHITKYIQ